jgi:hypothetical protein
MINVGVLLYFIEPVVRGMGPAYLHQVYTGWVLVVLPWHMETPAVEVPLVVVV